mmetsp:Transcript_9544/g.24089  ORF Transcript_9544/g.24089 Transcript_9544/m.24089 type:complete len:177 (+) Transcript_9544:407-937(+)
MGNGVSKSLPEAVRLWRLATDQGHAAAQGNVGIFHMEGSGGVAQDLPEAARYLRLAADQGALWAQYWLGFLCKFGKGTMRDINEAVHWYRAAAEQGNILAIAKLGLLHEKGRGVAQSDAESAARYAAARSAQGGELIFSFSQQHSSEVEERSAPLDLLHTPSCSARLGPRCQTWAC